MPEGHTIHRLARDLRTTFAGAAVHTGTLQERFAEGAAKLDGTTLAKTEAHGKHLFLHFSQDALRSTVHIHLGLYGKFPIQPQPAQPPRGALRLRLENDTAWADLRGPTACDLITRDEHDTILARLGPDPLRTDADPDRAWARISKSRMAIGALLMSQDVLSGIGNVYRAEVLFRHGISPFRAGREITREEWDAVWADLVVLLKAGVRAGRIVTTRPEDRPRRGRPRREESFYVYRRTGQPCRICGAEVRTELMVARNLFWCPSCQAH
ncbi:Fpg/Nei family DNA glycosylase [Nakamurella flavida]|uniref:DNA-(apurinic or apyrimidinic site) lyase n=1 Tax=Nakamurella flavida TaxID=363630 RepID=A0A939C4T0_9ACTN|nr:Fpg/Nei family DNA glycosylase [Nakamurella flavida]MBM9475532.1 Fpg/Nei family DNA glycosylase [Nakamurella flavida]MDP9778193.1 endonuclease-8 [Nakamurella flavida]